MLFCEYFIELKGMVVESLVFWFHLVYVLVDFPYFLWIFFFFCLSERSDPENYFDFFHLFV